MTKEQIAQTQAVAENITDRLIHLSDKVRQLYDAVSQIDADADDLSYDAIHLRNMLETDNEEE